MEKRTTLIGLFVTAGLLLGAQGEEKDRDRPERGFVAALAYPGVTVDQDDSISVDLIVKVTGRSDETILLEVIQKPEGWKAQVKGYGQVVSGVFVPAGESKTLTFSASLEGKEKRRLPAGTHRFEISAKAADGSMASSTSIAVTVIEKEKAEEAVTISTSYPVLRGPPDTSFEFSLDVRNETEEDSLFNFRAEPPPGWEVSFKPSYEQKQISSLQINANSSKSIEVQVKPAYNAEAKEYPIAVHVQAAKTEAKASTELAVVITGTYKIELTTPMGLLSFTALSGRETTVDLVAINRGSADQRDITLEAFKPENWKIEFDPEKIEGIKAGDFQQVKAKITPAEEALIGDYSVQVRADGEKSSDSVELRVTVKASSTWGWIGVAIIVVVIFGLAVTFKLVGRR